MPLRWLMTDTARLADPASMVKSLPTGTGIIFRQYEDRNRRAEARALATVCRAENIPLLIAGDWRLALAVNAQGIHLPEWMLSRPALWRRAKPSWWITAAAHGRESLIRARDLGIDAVTLSPVFPTRSHPDARPLGPIRFACLVKNVAQHFHVYALGGMSDKRLKHLHNSHISGWAGIGAWTETSPDDRIKK